MIQQWGLYDLAASMHYIITAGKSVLGGCGLGVMTSVPHEGQVTHGGQMT